MSEIWTNCRQAWDLRLQRRFERALTEAAGADTDPTGYLAGLHAAMEAEGWTPAMRLTLAHVPEQFRPLWTQEKARWLVESALFLATLRYTRQEQRGRMMREAFIPALEVQP